MGWLFKCSIFLSVLIACSRSREEPAGNPIRETRAFPGVVQVHQGAPCTGVAISPRAILTAAHCLKIPGRRALQAMEILGSGHEDDPNDLALLIYPSPIVNHADTFPIASSIEENERVTLVGFGSHSPDQFETQPRKRMGTNRVSSVGKFIEISSPTHSPALFGGEYRTGAGPGDSGGPAFKGSARNYSVAGICHANYEDGDEWVSVYVDLSRSDNQKFLREASEKWSLGIRFD